MPQYSENVESAYHAMLDTTLNHEIDTSTKLNHDIVRVITDLLPPLPILLERPHDT